MCKCLVHNAKMNGSLLIANQRKDPTRTLTLRNAFVMAMNKTFTQLRKEILQAVWVDDVFDLEKKSQPVAFLANVSPGAKAYEFLSSSQKVEAFGKWLQTRIDEGMLKTTTLNQLGSATNQAWINTYVADSYKRGILRARYEMKKAGMSKIPSIEDSGGLDFVMGTPLHIDRLGLLYSRVFSELKGITKQMDTQISRILAQGLADGDGPRLLARKMVAVIDGTGAGTLGIKDSLGRFIPARRRAEILARTETIRAHHQSMIQEYENWGVVGVEVQAEWSTAGDERVCAVCESLQGSVWSLKEIMNAIPVHPQCRCMALPVVQDKIPSSDSKTINEDLRFNPIKSVKTETERDLALKQFNLKYNLVQANLYEDKITETVLKRINAMGESLEDIFSKLPKNFNNLAKNADYCRVTVETWKGQFDMPRQVLARYWPRMRQIELKSTMVRMKQFLNIGKKWNVGTDFHTNFRHEYGHHVWFSMLDSKKKRVFNVFYSSKSKQWWTKNVSGYGSTDHLEAFAEVFSAYTSPEYGLSGKRFVKELEELMENLIGKRIDL